MHSIRKTLIAGLVTAVLGVSALAGTVLILVVRERVIDEFDEGLSAQARAMAGMVRRDEKDHVEMNFADEMLHEFTPGRRAEYFSVINQDGQVIERSPSWERKSGQFLLPDPSKEGKVVAATLPDGRAGRMVAMTFVPEAADDDERKNATQPRVTLMLARGTEPIAHTLELIGWGLAAAALVMAAGAAGAVWVLVAKGLKPLNGLAEQAQRIDAGNLAMRFGEHVPLELRPIVERLNELLARLEGAFARERRFTSAAAHELRTPIAELRAMAEVAIRWPGSHQQGMPEVLATAQNMEALAASLLSLSRCESGQERPRHEPIDLAHAVSRAWEPIAQKAVRRGVTLRVDQSEPAMVLGDPAMVDGIVRNLLENAAEYAPKDTEIECRIGMDRLEIINQQEGLTHADLEHLFEPFWRKDKARTAGIHAGLGLSLVRAYAAAILAHVDVALIDASKFRVIVRFATPTDVMIRSSSTDT